MIVTFIPAAGRSTRMGGRDKLLETVGGTPILKRTAKIAISAGLGPVVVGLRPGDRARTKALRNLRVQMVEVPDADEGMAATLRAGARMAIDAIEEAYPSVGGSEYFGMMILLPDMPEIDADDLVKMNRVFQANGGPVVRATTADNKPGHPVLVPDHLLRDFRALAGDKGAISLLEGERVVEAPLSGHRARRDLDTPEDWAAWRKETGIQR